MKKFIFFILLAIATTSQAYVYVGYDGVWYGNICRNGALYQVVPFQPVNTYCFMPGWNSWGMLSWE